MLVFLFVLPPAGSALSIADYDITDTPNGGDCSVIGAWDAASKTCTLSTDLIGAGTALIQVSDSGITLDGNFHTLTGSGTGSDIGVYITGVTGVTVENVNAEAFGYGFYLDNADSNTLTGNTGSNNQLNAIYLGSSTSNEVSDNTLMNNASNGVRLDNSTGNAFIGNTINNNGSYGIYASWSDQTNLVGNEASGNTLDGVSLVNSDNCQLTLNTMADNARGLYLSTADGAVISGNTLTTNGTGTLLASSPSASVYNNNFLSNTIQAEVTGGGANSFNLPAPDGGNYWDDFDEAAEDCTDANGDGFCDAPYIFSGGQDALPWTSFNGWVDTTPPTVQNVQPSGTITSAPTTISADYSDSGSGVDTSSVAVTLDGTTLTGCTVSASSVSCPVSGIGYGAHTIGGSVADKAGNPANISGSFDYDDITRDYYFTWYDNLGGSNWVLMANPASGGATESQYFETVIGTLKQDLSPFHAWQGSVPCTDCEPGEVPPGYSLAPQFQGAPGGPVKVTSLTGGSAVVSERTLWPKGGSSLEEVVGFEKSRLSSQYYWTWYDQLSPGYTNWVLVANPSQTEIVRVEIIIAGQPRQNLLDKGRPDYAENYFDIGPGENLIPTFLGVMGGPVEVRAYRGPSSPGGGDAGSWAQAGDHRDVIASQRVLSGFGIAFNEAVGVPVDELSDHYVWSWYDAAEPGARNWVLIANPNDAASNQYLYYTIKIGGIEICRDGDCFADPAKQGPIAGGDYVTPEFPGMRGGPVEVLTFSDTGHNNPAPSIASQRIVWGPSFGETMGYRYQDLSGEYHWTWYDQASLGMQNWVLIANPSGGNPGLHYEISVSGNLVCEDSVDDHAGAAGCAAASPGSWQAGTLAPGEKSTPTFSGLMGGPVEVRTFSDSEHTISADGIASQRVLYNGFFNEVIGTVLN